MLTFFLRYSFSEPFINYSFRESFSQYPAIVYPTGLNKNSGGNKCEFRSYNDKATDNYVAKLTFPPNGLPRPQNAVGIESDGRIHYGVIKSRFRVADCTDQPKAGMVSSLFTYFNNGSDTTGSGMSDNSEIDFEFLCANTDEVHVTMYTDYNDDGSKCSYMSRAVNVKTGQFSHSWYIDCQNPRVELTGNEAYPSSITPIPDFEPHKNFYTYTIDWRPNRMIFSIKSDNGPEVILWDYSANRSRITQVPAYILSNLWHTNNWYPGTQTDCVQTPIINITTEYDYIEYQTYNSSSDPAQNSSSLSTYLVVFSSIIVITILISIYYFYPKEEFINEDVLNV